MTRTLVLLMLIVSGVQAQNIQLGIKGGWNYTHLNDLPDPMNQFDFSESSDVHIGGYLNIGLSEKWSLQPEVLYSGKGGKIFLTDSTGGKEETTINLSYLTFPLLIQYRSSFLSIHAGPELGWQLARDASGDRMGILDAEVYDQPFDLSGVAGITLHLGQFFITGRYGRAFTDLVEIQETDQNGQTTGKGTYGYNEFWQISLGLRLF